jgi:hypothetical protein
MKFEIKEALAKLLATENLIVEHRQVGSASFDVDRRVLTLPMWQKASNRVYDLLVGHEVGHALYTPNVDWREGKYAKVPYSFVNIVEDARIEKMMKRRYAGLSKTFYKGYQELHDLDFFSLEGGDINKMSLIDRINLYFKIGAYHMISFTEKESTFVKRGEDVETWEEVLDLSYDIHKYLDEIQEEQDKEKPKEVKPKNNQQSESTSEETHEDQSEPSEDHSEGNTDASRDLLEDDSEEEPTPESSGTGGGNEFDSTTDKAFDDNRQSLINEHARDSTYVNLPKEIDIDKIIIQCDKLQSYISDFYNRKLSYNDLDSFYMKQNAKEYQEYKKSATNGVNYLVKEFEMKKSAAAYSRAAISKSGSLDTSKLHNYKFSEDLFKKVTILPDGKNHGLIFILDWSGSMSDVIHDTVKQLLNLLWFCKKVNIPFEVYAFTFEFPTNLVEPDDDNEEIQSMNVNELSMNKHFRLLNLMSHKRNSSEFDRDCLNLWRLSSFTRYYGSSLIPVGLSLSGTPLNETIIAMHEILPMFSKETGVDKINAVLLTDGESCGIARTVKMSEKYYPEGAVGRVYLGSNCQLRDIKKGRVYKNFNEFDWDTSATNILLSNLKHNFPNVNLISYRVVPSGSVSTLFNYYTEGYSEDVKKKWTKERSAIVNTTGYDVMYAIASNTLNQSEDFVVNDDATKAQIRAAFRKSLKSKSANKKVLSSFATMVA